MGRGDKKTKKGKIFKGSFGKSRPAKPAKAVKAEVKEAEFMHPGKYFFLKIFVDRLFIKGVSGQVKPPVFFFDFD